MYVLNYNFDPNLRAVGRIAPFEAILGFYQKTRDVFIINPNHFTVGLNYSWCCKQGWNDNTVATRCRDQEELRPFWYALPETSQPETSHANQNTNQSANRCGKVHGESDRK
ncbi:MAG: hypothetical protein ACREI9_09115 [Nitrospiraceae bacterium]